MARSQTPLTEWLREACMKRTLSWREASIKAGVDKGTISAIMRGAQPGLEVCKGLAGLFNVPPEDVLRLAGHLSPNPAAAPVPELVLLMRKVSMLPHPVQQEVARAGQAVLAAIGASSEAAER